MTARIIDGKARAERATAEIKVQIAARVAAGKPPPGLAVVLVGEHPASQIYVRNKRRMTQAVGMKSFEFDLPGTVSQHELLSLIGRLNADSEVHGILVQLPLPKEIDADVVTESIDPAKDVDGLHPYNMGRLVLKRPTLRPCTPQGCMTLIRDTGEDLVGKHAVIIGQSNIVGRPMALELLMARCTVTICHSATRDLPAIVGSGGHSGCRDGQARLRAGRLDQAGRHRHRRGHQSHAGRKASRRRRFRIRQGARGVDHAGARRRRPDDHRHAARQHAARR